MKVKMISQIEGQFQVTLDMKGEKYYVQYKAELTIHGDFTKAFYRYRECVKHQLQCCIGGG